jgi:uncharacterized protein (DUF362 family)/Pyruvate/2-oxoacid:ferredoxin oxidoreductase delta subunit
MNATVSIVRTTDSPHLREAVQNCLNLIGTDQIKNAKSILLKPNCLVDKKIAASSPELIRSIIEVIQDIKKGQDFKLYIGDSPGLLTKKSQPIFRNLGIMDVIQATGGVTFVEFDGSEPPIQVQIPEGVRLKETLIAKIVEDVDLIVNIPKLKTHILSIYTGAIKNYWGTQPGGTKPRNHLKGTSTETFSEVLTDLYSHFAKRRNLVIMEAMEGMEGTGPSSGHMRPLNVLLGGYDPVAVDAVSVAIVGHDAMKEVPHLRMCTERNLGIGKLDEIAIVGTPLSEVQVAKPFRFPSKTVAWASGLFGPLAYRFTKKVPTLRRSKCTRCGNCAKICPGGAIQLTPYPHFNRRKCVQCLCCVECCPSEALRVGIAGVMGLLGFQ